MRKLPLIEIGYTVFLGDGADAFGAVRKVGAHKPELVINVEGSGDFHLPLDSVEKVAGKRVVVSWARLEDNLKEAISHSLDQEDFPPAGGPEDEVELLPPHYPSQGGPEIILPFEADDDSLAPSYEGPRHKSPPGEFPGRDVGARYGAPPSVTVIRPASENLARGRH